MPGTQATEGKPFISIIAGSFAQKVDQSHPDAKLRTWEKKDGTTGEKYEIYYNDWTGIIKDVRFQDGDYGKSLHIDMGDVVISINTESRYFADIAKKLAGTDWTKEHTFHPYDFEGDNGKKLTGVSIKVGGEKVRNYFYEPEEKKTLHGFPEVEGEYSDYDKDDWKTFFIKVKKFLVKYIEDKAEFTPDAPTMESEAKESTGEDSYDESQANAQVPTTEVKVEDLPF